MHWAESYVGVPYVPREFDCVALVELVSREQFNRELKLPTERPASLREMGAAILNNRDVFADETTSPVEGDAVLMSARGQTHWHVGVYCVISGEAWCLHNFLDVRAVALHPVRELDRYGLTLEGYYQWR